jgi:predicted N-acetyltransferase YhbS
MRPAIREEAPGDAAAIHRLNASAFVDALRAAGALTLSLIAEEDGEIVGHIAFSPVVVAVPTMNHAATATRRKRPSRALGATCDWHVIRGAAANPPAPVGVTSSRW